MQDLKNHIMDLLVIGFDGADFELMEQLVEEEKLPNIESLIENGSHGELESTSIPITPCAWTSFMTGKNPGKHGIFDFTRVTENGLEVVRFDDVEEDTVFELLSPEYRVGTLNIPATYPPRDVNGFMVSGMMSPSIEKATDDPDVEQILREEDYMIEVPATNTGSGEEELLERCHDTLETRTRTAKRLMQENNPDLFMPVFTVGDRISHWFWKYHDTEHPEFEESDYRNEVENIYMEIDSAIGELVEEAGGLDETNVVIMSDHGFTGLYRSLNLNNALMEQGLLKLKSRPSTRLRKLGFDLGFTLENIYRVAGKLGLGNFIKSMSDDPDREWAKKLLQLPFLSFDDVDFERSKAYSAMHFGPVFLLDEDAREEVIELLEGLEHGGQKVVENIESGEDLFHGRKQDEAPDIVYHTRGMHYQAHRYFEFGSNKIFSWPSNMDSGHHRLEGIFVGAGPDLEPRGELEDASIMDVTPTILTMLGEQVPGDMDGKVLDIVSGEVEMDESAIDDF